MLAYAYYEQYVNDLNPCPLCLVQRFIVLLLGLLFFITFIFSPKFIWKKIFFVLKLLTSITGVFVSAWHVRLQNLPADEIPDCGPGLGYMIENFPVGTIIKNLFTGSGQCAEVSWRFLGLSMPAWTLIVFTGYIFYTVFWLKIKNEQ